VKIFPIKPAHPERLCWGCNRYCPADAMMCAADRTQHPFELLGDEWVAEWGFDSESTLAFSSSSSPTLK
jgi:hypothetical protein